MITDHDGKAAAMYNFYNVLIRTSVDRNRTINLDELNIIAHELGQLDAPFSEDEVWSTIHQLRVIKRQDLMDLRVSSIRLAGQL